MRQPGRQLPMRQPANRRSAFTLIELLIVIAIIATLATLSLVASMHFLNTARVAATRTTIKKIDELVNTRLTAYQSSLDPRQLDGGARVDSEIFRKYRGYVGDSALGRKRLTVKFFGMTHGEVPLFGNNQPASWATADLNSVDLSKNPDYVSANDTNPTTNNPEMLYHFLINGPTFGATPVDKDAFTTAEVGDLDGDGLPEFIDAWGQPIRFYRWPTRLLRPAPATAPGSQATGNNAYFSLKTGVADPAYFLLGTLPTFSTAGDDPTKPLVKSPTELGQDRDDPFGTVLRDFAGVTAASPLADQVSAAQLFEKYYHTPNTWHAFMIVSAGPDLDLGLYEPSDTANFGHLAQPMAGGSAAGYSQALEDDITNLNSRASGSGGR